LQSCNAICNLIYYLTMGRLVVRPSSKLEWGSTWDNLSRLYTRTATSSNAGKVETNLTRSSARETWDYFDNSRIKIMFRIRRMWNWVWAKRNSCFLFYRQVTNKPLPEHFHNFLLQIADSCILSLGVGLTGSTLICSKTAFTECVEDNLLNKSNFWRKVHFRDLKLCSVGQNTSLS
jgi:hypothetical protein